MHRLEKNISVYYFFKFFQNMLIIGPILVPFLIFKGLSYSEIMLLQSISAVSVFVFEVPTGVVADKVSRRFSLSLCTIIMAIGLSFYIFFNDFIFLAMAELLFGIGMTFGSGADSAILFESLNRLGKKEKYRLIEGKCNSNIYLGQGIGSILSSFLYSVSPFFPFWISLGSLGIATASSFMFHEPEEREKSGHSYMKHIVKGFGVALKLPRVRWAMGFAALMGFAVRVGYWLYQPYFKEVNLDIIWYGLIFFGFNMVSAFSARYLMKKFEGSRPRKTLTVLGYIMAASYLLPLIFLGKAGIIFLALQQIVRGMYKPTMRFYINHQISDAYRATVISIIGLCANLSFAILSPFVGLGLDNSGTIPVYLVIGLSVSAVTALLWKLRNVQKKKLKGSAAN